MEDLRLTGVSEDGTHLLLAAPGAESAAYRVPVDQALHAAVRGDHARRPERMESTVRPKEIQARIRAGQTPEEVASAAGVPLAKIEAFASPVIRERAHIAEVAQRTAVRRPGESHSGGELGEMVADRLRARGVDPADVEWDAWRREDGTWKVRLHYKLANRSGTAEWIYDASARHVRPVDEEAAALVSSSASTHPTEPNLGEILERPRLAAVGGGQVTGPPSVASADSGEPSDPPRQPLRIARQPAKASKRASVPSWDEIIFGTRRQQD